MQNIPIQLNKIDLKVPPFEVYGRLRSEFRNSFMLESAVGAQRTVAYSFLGFGPRYLLTCRDGKVSGGEGNDDLREDPVAYLSRFASHPQVRDGFPFVGGLVGYFSYEFAKFVEPTSVPSLPSEFPDFELGYYDECLIYDHSNFQVYHATVGEGSELKDLLGSLPDAKDDGLKASAPTSLTDQRDYENGVRAIKERIRDGETFQTVLSRKLFTTYQGDLLNLYRSLRELSPSPYMFYLDFGSRTVLGSSPETLITVRGREATTFPIAGTRPLGNGMKERRMYREDMLLDEKEKAEHCMLVDLARNDLGRVCEAGSVNVPEYMRVEEFSHVQHIVSKVQGVLDSGKSSVDALRAIFPAGTVSGAPKPRAMEIIAELEGKARGPYAGGVGYISANGNLDSAITIRSAFASDDKLYFQAGAGIVADSDPEREWKETEHKLSALMRAFHKSTGDEA